jgi:hypothetical protein
MQPAGVKMFFQDVGTVFMLRKHTSGLTWAVCPPVGRAFKLKFSMDSIKFYPRLQKESVTGVAIGADFHEKSVWGHGKFGGQENAAEKKKRILVGLSQDR